MKPRSLTHRHTFRSNNSLYIKDGESYIPKEGVRSPKDEHEDSPARAHR
jgi:hypothetical protein